MIRRLLHRLRTFACIDGDPQPSRCSSSWCWVDHSSDGYCDAITHDRSVEPVRVLVCDLPEAHDGHHHDLDADTKWSKGWAA